VFRFIGTSSLPVSFYNQHVRRNRQPTKRQEEVSIVATAVGAYEVEIITGLSEGEVERAKINLFAEQGGDRIGRIYFYGPQVILESDFVDRGSNPVLHLHIGTLSSVLALLDGEKPLFIELTEQNRGRLTTTEAIIF
jgi:hypothetical protein